MKISTKRALKQLKEDLTGKDSQTGITLSYAWLANQYGHISLGFIPAFLLHHFFKTNAFSSAIYISLIWLIFEIINFLTSFSKQRKSKSTSALSTNTSRFEFKPKWSNVVFDTFTDVCFFALGAFLFSLCVTRGTHQTTIIIVIVLGAYLLFASKFWFVTKMYQQNAKYPFQFRLSQWNYNLSDNDKGKIINFLNSKKNDGHHLLIYGNFGSGKTSLGVGILNELSIKHNSCLYKNGIKMFNAFFENDAPKDNEIWNWRMANFLMVDNINPSEPIEDSLISPEKLLSFIDTLNDINEDNRQILLSKNVIWVLGNKSNLQIKENDKWINMLLKIGVDNNKIATLNLSE